MGQFLSITERTLGKKEGREGEGEKEGGKKGKLRLYNHLRATQPETKAAHEAENMSRTKGSISSTHGFGWSNEELTTGHTELPVKTHSRNAYLWLKYEDILKAFFLMAFHPLSICSVSLGKLKTNYCLQALAERCRRTHPFRFRAGILEQSKKASGVD